MKQPNEFYHKLLSESPMQIGDGDDYYNKEMDELTMKYREIIDNPSTFKKVFTFNTNPELYLYEEKDGNDVVCWAVPPNNKFVYAYVAYEIKPDGGVITTSVFNDRKFPTVAYRIYQDYLLGKYKYIMSDGRHTNRGESFWRKHIYTSVNDYTKKVYIWDNSLNQKVIEVTNPKQVEEFYSIYDNFEKFRIRIENI